MLSWCHAREDSDPAPLSFSHFNFDFFPLAPLWIFKVFSFFPFCSERARARFKSGTLLSPVLETLEGLALSHVDHRGRCTIVKGIWLMCVNRQEDHCLSNLASRAVLLNYLPLLCRVCCPPNRTGLFVSLGIWNLCRLRLFCFSQWRIWFNVERLQQSSSGICWGLKTQVVMTALRLAKFTCICCSICWIYFPSSQNCAVICNFCL